MKRKAILSLTALLLVSSMVPFPAAGQNVLRDVGEKEDAPVEPRPKKSPPRTQRWASPGGEKP